ncbi:CRISPR-associated protein Cas4 [Alicyclobacillus cellulosilyticus]|uniref:CRISPR-associated exonuclease Cas4 n=1 Tax=Alicyclobacillus cellulosilyticus TaxID=1003997 RepID=A0A917K8J0_9BACL|nr:CRISPR-associated protein Cas4 [Alicyclobacillus cellulosilyticus]GGJ03894.1 CRISPR-associated protein Cas4 [Alicyclobacillus cellulosilyticus]
MDDDALIPISALEHYAYCPRQCALIHVEQTFDENRFTLGGRMAHARVDAEHVLSARGHQILTGLTVWSDRYGLIGRCDVVELRDGRPYPVEFKRGTTSRRLCHQVQLCAQVLCLEEMFGVDIPEGAIYHVSSRRRTRVALTTALREQTQRILREVRAMLQSQTLPPAVRDARCNHCSLQDACLPVLTGRRRPFDWYRLLEDDLAAETAAPALRRADARTQAASVSAASAHKTKEESPCP